MTQDPFRALKGQPSDEAEVKKIFLERYKGFKITRTHYDYVDRKWYVWGHKREAKVLIIQKSTFYV